MQFPLSQFEHAAIARRLSDVRKQLQDLSDLFSSRYGKESSIAELGVKALVSATLLEHELMLQDRDEQHEEASAEEADSKGLGRAAH